MSCEDCEDVNDGSPPCEDCDRPRTFTYAEEEAIRIWTLCDAGAREYVGLGAVPTNIRIEAVLRLCEVYGHGTDILDLVLFLERVAYPLRYPPKDAKSKTGQTQGEA